MIRYVYASHGWLHGGSTRTDLDALGSVAILWRGAHLKGLKRGVDFELDLIDYYGDGIDALRRWRGCTILLADIPPEAVARPDRPDTVVRLEDTLRYLKAHGNKLNYIDHHPLEGASADRFQSYVERGWLERADLSFRDADADQAHDHTRKRCAAEMVRDFLQNTYGLPQDDVIDEIARLAHDQDFGVRQIPGANRISAIIGADFPPLELAERLSDGAFWNGRMENAWRIQEENTRRQIEQMRFSWRTWQFASGRRLRVVYALMPWGDVLKVTPASIHCLESLGADIAILVQRVPFISMRIRWDHNDLHAGRLLASFGGGGHLGAASAGGRTGNLPYGRADEHNFEDVVGALDRELTARGDFESVREYAA